MKSLPPFSAYIPIAMSLLALLVVLIHVAFVGTAREPDEGTSAHLWQVLIALQVPIVAYFAMRWLPRLRRRGLVILAIQFAAAFIAAAPVWLLGL